MENRNSIDEKRIQEEIYDIAKKTLGINTLMSRNCDRLDFYDLSVENIHRALLAAYFAGQASRNLGADK